MEEKVEYISQEAADALAAELEELKKTKMPAIARRIDEARQMGDLSENAEYHAAKDEMGWAHSRSKKIEHILKNASIITHSGSTDEVAVGSTITVSVAGKEREYTIVGAQEADPMARKISNESPLGSAFLGKRKGDVVDVEIPSGTQSYTILSIT